MFNHLKNCQTFPKWLYHFTFPLTLFEGSTFSTFSLILIICLFFLSIAVLLVMKWYLIIVLICILLVANDIEHLFMCMLAMCVSSLRKCIQILCPSLNCFFSHY
ncbi:unnamed protein product [Rangifer tarandus platyrhynchus]|uniref:Uncharacterized protein n=1 Tax=Rangifer tarandus platyrhynchus TaxID=3082113 RepID=A0AC59YM04_RANTA